MVPNPNPRQSKEHHTTTITIADARRQLRNCRITMDNAYRAATTNTEEVRQTAETQEGIVDQLVALEDAGARLPADLKAHTDFRRRYTAALKLHLDQGTDPALAHDRALSEADRIP